MAIDPFFGSIATGLLGGIFGSNNVSSANQMAAEQARENRDWQERMSNTSHQREVEDLRKAGLNPILTATGGSGASTPSGSTSSFQAYDPSSVVSSINSGLKLSAIDKEQLKLQSARTSQDIKESDSRIAVNSSTMQKNAEDIKSAISTQMVNAEMVKKYGAETAKLYQDIEVLKLHPNLVLANIGLANANAGLAGANSAVSFKQLEVLQAQIDKLVSETGLNKARLPKEQTFGSFWDNVSGIYDRFRNDTGFGDKQSIFYSGNND